MVMPLPEGFRLRRAALETHQQTVGPRAGLYCVARRRERVGKGLIGGDQRVHPDGRGGVRVAEHGGGQCVRPFAVLGVQQLRHRAGKAVKLHQPVQRVGEIPRLHLERGGAAQHRVHHTGGAGLAHGFGEFDGFVHRRGQRHLHEPGLCQPGAQNGPHRCVQFGNGTPGKSVQTAIQKILSFQRGIEDASRKGGIAGFQRRTAGFHRGVPHKV